MACILVCSLVCRKLPEQAAGVLQLKVCVEVLCFEHLGITLDNFSDEYDSKHVVHGM